VYLPQAGLPDGLFSNQKSKFWIVLKGIRQENVEIFFAIWNILQTFGYFMTIWYSYCSFFGAFFRFGIMYQDKSGNPDPKQLLRPKSFKIFNVPFDKQTMF
jgi:hypothetical protein